MSKKTQKLLDELVEYINSNEGISQKDLAKTFTMKLTKLNYYIKQLLLKKLIRRDRIREGKTQSYFLFSANSDFELQKPTSKKVELQENKSLNFKNNFEPEKQKSDDVVTESIKVENNLVGKLDDLMTGDLEKLSKVIDEEKFLPLPKEEKKQSINNNFVKSLKNPGLITQEDLERIQMDRVLADIRVNDKKRYKFVKYGGPKHADLRSNLQVFNRLFNKNNLI